MQDIKNKQPEILHLIDQARPKIPIEIVDRPWKHPCLNHGLNILSDEEALDCYLVAYGSAHRKKLEHAFEHFPIREIDKPYELFDWGCGQGLATIEFLDFLYFTNNLEKLPKVITLIEPSKKALQRAQKFINNCISNNVELRVVNDYLPSIGDYKSNIDDNYFDIKTDVVIHLFSNIIDVECIDLKQLSNIIKNKNKIHYIVCVGPCHSQQNRIDAFSRYFNIDNRNIFLDIKDYEFGYHSNGKSYTCRIKEFKIDLLSQNEELIFFDFYPPCQFYCGYCLDLLQNCKLTNSHNVEHLFAFDVVASYDIGAQSYENANPIISVLNNIICRGIPTKASPFIEKVFSDIFEYSEESLKYGTIEFNAKYNIDYSNIDECIIKCPIEIARIQKILIECILSKHIKIKEEWDVLVLERDVPCAAIAIMDLAQMFTHLTKLSNEYNNLNFPKINLTIISSKYSESKLHLNHKTYKNFTSLIKNKRYDIFIDTSIDDYILSERNKITNSDIKSDFFFYIRSTKCVNGIRKIITTNRIIYKDIVLNENQRYIEIEENVCHLRYFLQLIFRKKDFREGQLPILNRALKLQSVIGLLPTGGGKSLTYQLAAILQPGVSIVVDPLVTLMKDQYDGLIKVGIDCCTYINSQIEGIEKDARINNMSSSYYMFVFLSPERLCIASFRQQLKDMSECGVYFSYGIIDEVHCVSEWGHDFRFSYLHLGRNLYNYVLPKQDTGSEHISLFGLTATASFDVLADVERELSGNNSFPLSPDSTVRFENTNRLELQYKVIKIPIHSISSSKWDVFDCKANNISYIIKNELYTSLKQLLEDRATAYIKKKFLERENINDENIKNKVNKTDLNVDINDSWFNNEKHDCAAIVFCPHRQGTIGVKDSASKIGISNRIQQDLNCNVSSFVGGDSVTAQDDFINNKTGIMVATNAFGMGIDKPNVRFTLNINHSGSLEAFVQEAGRAGRDRKMALSLILYSDLQIEETNTITYSKEIIPVDYSIHKFFYDNNFIGNELEKAIIYYILHYYKFFYEINKDDKAIIKESFGFINAFMNSKDFSKNIYFIGYGKKYGDFTGLKKFLSENRLGNVSLSHFSSCISKAIYRMCCIGLIDDFTQDYKEEIFKIVVIKRKQGYYYESLTNIMRRYFGEERAIEEALKARNYKADSEVENVLAFFTDFVYQKIAMKRIQAIKDMEEFCKIGSSGDNWLETNEVLKDHIYYYFNSKFARERCTASNGEQYSLVQDTDHGKKFSFDLVKKYMKVIDDSIFYESTPKDNIKHLQGAVRLIRRSVTEDNPALDLINVFCILYLKSGDRNITYSDLEESYINACLGFYKASINIHKYYSDLMWFENEIGPNGLNIVDNDDIHFLNELKYAAEAYIHIEKINKIFRVFLNKDKAKIIQGKFI